MQIMYGIRGERDLTETTLDHLSGYEGAKPVRIGNAAYNQRQNDVYGALLDSVYIHAKVQDHLPHELWDALCRQVETAIAVWEKPDQGIWEGRGEPKHYVSSKLMCWVAARPRLLASPTASATRSGCARWTKIADRSARTSSRTGVSDRGVFRQHYDTDALDASTLLVPLVRFLPPDDERVVNTVKAIAGGAHRGRPRPPLPRRPDRRRTAGRGGDLPDLLLLARLRPLRDRRAADAAREMCEQPAAPWPARSASTPRSSTRGPAATGATSLRPSPTWR